MWIWPLVISAMVDIVTSVADGMVASPIRSLASQHTSLNGAFNVTEVPETRYNISSLTTPRALCSGTAYGRDLQIQDCLDALNHGMGHDTRQATFGHRNQGMFGNLLPQRALSGEATPSAGSFIQAVLTNRPSRRSLRIHAQNPREYVRRRLDARNIRRSKSADTEMSNQH